MSEYKSCALRAIRSVKFSLATKLRCNIAADCETKPRATFNRVELLKSAKDKLSLVSWHSFTRISH